MPELKKESHVKLAKIQKVDCRDNSLWQERRSNWIFRAKAVIL